MKDQGYFHRVAQQTPTMFWINNPSRREADLAIEEGAVGCTTNPSFVQKLIDHPTDKAESAYALEMLDRTIGEFEDDNQAISILQQRLAKPIMDKFFPIYEKTGGKKGYVSVQGDPVHEDDPEVILREGRRNRAISENACIKIPTTASGLEAMQALIAEAVPLNATECFAVAQLNSLLDAYERSTKRSGKKPIFHISHIAGIYDDHLRQYVEKEKVDISPDVLWQAGCAVARKVYDIMKKRDPEIIFVGGGARGLHHFTEMVGGDLVVTINWRGTADQLLESNPPVVYRLFNPVPQKVIDELMEKLPDFRRGYLDDGLTVEEYHHFGPVVLFRNSFLKSWHRVLDLIKERRAAL
jgi:transaldolase